MKKTKLLMPLTGIAALGAITPVIMATTSCGSKGSSTITLDGSELVLTPGQTATLKATCSSGADVTWSSSDEAVATVNGGLVVAIAEGEATIAAEADGQKAECHIKVTLTPVEPTETDKEFLDEINGLMLYGSDYVSPHKAITALKDMGYDVLSRKLSNPEMEFAFDASAKRFIIMHNDDIKAAPSGYEMKNSQVVFKFTDSYDQNSKYGQYLLDDYVWTDPTTQFEITASIDVGNNKNIKNMKYVPSSETNESQTKLVRTYCEYLNFSENNDTIIHMGESNNIEVYGTDETNVCDYTELGRTAYFYAKNAKLQIAKLNGIDITQIDVLETDTNVTAGTLFHPEFITMLVSDYDLGGKTKTAPTNVGTLADLKAAFTAGNPFIRLTSDITITDSTAITITDKSFVLDLGGKKLIDNSTVTAATALIDIEASSADSSLMFIDSYRQGAFVLKDHFINVLGNADSAHTGKKTATLYLEGANITYDATSNRNGAIEVGRTKTTGDATGFQYSRVYMFGGKIEANTESTSHDIEVSGIYANDDAYIQIVYGAIYSSTNCIRSNGLYEGAYIDIVDGTFKTNNDTVGECIYMPNGKLNISGGTFEGHTCLGIRGGNTQISGGYFKATGETADINTAESAASGIGGDGSVICIELCNGASATAYGTNPSLTISNGTLYSKNSYIIQLFRNNSTTDVNQFFEADFFGGVYYYGKEVTDPVYNGIRIGSATGLSDSNYRINQQDGSWIYTGR